MAGRTVTAWVSARRIPNPRPESCSNEEQLPSPSSHHLRHSAVCATGLFSELLAVLHAGGFLRRPYDSSFEERHTDSGNPADLYDGWIHKLGLSQTQPIQASWGWRV